MKSEAMGTETRVSLRAITPKVTADRELTIPPNTREAEVRGSVMGAVIAREADGKATEAVADGQEGNEVRLTRRHRSRVHVGGKGDDDGPVGAELASENTISAMAGSQAGAPEVVDICRRAISAVHLRRIAGVDSHIKPMPLHKPRKAKSSQKSLSHSS